MRIAIACGIFAALVSAAAAQTTSDPTAKPAARVLPGASRSSTGPSEKTTLSPTSRSEDGRPVTAPLKPAGAPGGRAAVATSPTSTTGTDKPGVPGKSTKLLNEEAQRAAIAREKRWDDRMRRVTRSMCNGC